MSMDSDLANDLDRIASAHEAAHAAVARAVGCAGVSVHIVRGKGEGCTTHDPMKIDNAEKAFDHLTIILAGPMGVDLLLPMRLRVIEYTRAALSGWIEGGDEERAFCIAGAFGGWNPLDFHARANARARSLLCLKWNDFRAVYAALLEGRPVDGLLAAIRPTSGSSIERIEQNRGRHVAALSRIYPPRRFAAV
jgi:hypothetical protein